MTPAQTNATTTVHPHDAKNGSGGSALPTLVVFGFIVTLLFFLFMLYFWNNDVFRKLLRALGSSAVATASTRGKTRSSTVVHHVVPRATTRVVLTACHRTFFYHPRPMAVLTTRH
uniref:Orf UL140 n=1 Tax=Human cytomegalovirus (strain Toledo) TaxID=311339 RepID=Q68392_HCMVO|nr:orf UL140 [Human betaherpesvirus 5]